jgi:SAM-dependent methyltransferase
MKRLPDANLAGAAPENDWVGTMRKDWDQRARENAHFYICTDVASDEDVFFESGADDFDRLVRPWLARSNFDPAGKTALEIGCGIGRMTRWLAGAFQQVVGMDISPEMIERARSYNVANARFELGSGRDLRGIDPCSVDFVFSYIVFQHIPDRNVILEYFKEIGRVLRPGGLFRVHLNGLPYVDFGGRVLEGYISRSPRLRKFGVKSVPFVRRRQLGSWLGHPIALTDLHPVLRSGDLRLQDVKGRWTDDMWVGGIKEAACRLDPKGIEQ